LYKKPRVSKKHQNHVKRQKVQKHKKQRAAELFVFLNQKKIIELMKKIIASTKKNL
jgi:hypothetical protein